jgi:hypothetical protein
MPGPTVLFGLWVQVNEGNVILYGIAPTAETTANLTSSIVCNPSGTLAVAATMTCIGTFTFSQAAFEAGSRIFEAALESANLTAAAASNAVNIVPIEVPSVTVSILLNTCDPPEDAGERLCCFYLHRQADIRGGAAQHPTPARQDRPCNS